MLKFSSKNQIIYFLLAKGNLSQNEIKSKNGKSRFNKYFSNEIKGETNREFNGDLGGDGSMPWREKYGGMRIEEIGEERMDGWMIRVVGREFDCKEEVRRR